MKKKFEKGLNELRQFALDNQHRIDELRQREIDELVDQFSVVLELRRLLQANKGAGKLSGGGLHKISSVDIAIYETRKTLWLIYQDKRIPQELGDTILRRQDFEEKEPGLTTEDRVEILKKRGVSCFI